MEKSANIEPQPINTETEDRELPEEAEIEEETDYGHSSSSSANTTLEKEQHSSPLAAALLPPEPVVDPNMVGADTKKSETTRGSNEKQVAEPTDEPTEVDKADSSKKIGGQGGQPTETTTGSNEKQAAESTEIPTEVVKLMAVKKIDRQNSQLNQLIKILQKKFQAIRIRRHHYQPFNQKIWARK